MLFKDCEFLALACAAVARFCALNVARELGGAFSCDHVIPEKLAKGSSAVLQGAHLEA
jgi:hypothetical protein